MITEIAAPPAGESEQAPVATTTAPETLSQDAAVSRLLDLEDKPAASEEAATPPSSTEPSSEPPADAAATEEATGEAAPQEEAAPPPEEGEPEAQSKPEEIIHGNSKTRLRTGEVVAVSDLKKGWDELQEYRARIPQLSAAQQQLQVRAAQIAQQEQVFAKVLPIAMQVLSGQAPPIPPAPDPELVQQGSPKYDPVLYLEQKVAHDTALSQYQMLQAGVAAQQHQTGEQRKAAQSAYLREQQALLVDKMPDLKTPERRAEAYKEFLETATQFGFSQSEADSVYDHRIFSMVHELSKKAKQLDKLQAELKSQKTVAEKKAINATSVAPVQAPGRRVSPSEQKASNRQELFQKARASDRSVDSIAAILEKLS
jgi:hypothetical protein